MKFAHQKHRVKSITLNNKTFKVKNRISMHSMTISIQQYPWTPSLSSKMRKSI